MRAMEIGKWTDYDYVIVNEDLDRSFPMARAILTAERLRRERVTGLPASSTALAEGSRTKPIGRLRLQREPT